MNYGNEPKRGLWRLTHHAEVVTHLGGLISSTAVDKYYRTAMRIPEHITTLVCDYPFYLALGGGEPTYSPYRRLNGKYAISVVTNVDIPADTEFQALVKFDDVNPELLSLWSAPNLRAKVKCVVIRGEPVPPPEAEAKDTALIAALIDKGASASEQTGTTPQ